MLERVLGAALARGGDLAEVFAEDRQTSGAMLDDGRIEELSSGRERGAGIRVIVGETTGFAHTADLSEPGLLAAADAAAAVARQGGGGVKTVALSERRPVGHRADVLPRAWPSRPSSTCCPGPTTRRGRPGRRSPRFRPATGTAAAGCSSPTPRGSRPKTTRCAPGSTWSCVATGDTGMQTGYESVARTEGLEVFERVDVDDVARTAADRALSKLAARPAPSGEVPVVLAGGSGGILFHEACGHGLEADHIVKDASVYVGQVGKLVASPLVTLVDDGTVAGEWGNFVDRRRGTPGRSQRAHRARRTHRLHVGLLRARKEGRESSGNGRRQSYQHLPMVRMTNTFLLAGTDDPDEIVAQTPNGVYVAKLGGDRSTRRPATSCSGRPRPISSRGDGSPSRSATPT